MLKMLDMSVFDKRQRRKMMDGLQQMTIIGYPICLNVVQSNDNANVEIQAPINAAKTLAIQMILSDFSKESQLYLRKDFHQTYGAFVAKLRPSFKNRKTKAIQLITREVNKFSIHSLNIYQRNT